jgi:hypothetical protein
VDTPIPRLTYVEVVRQVCWAGKVLAIAVFVVWHLLFLLIRNPLDVRGARSPVAFEPAGWDGLAHAWRTMDEATTTYGNVLRIEQGWTLFTPPMARDGDFLSVRLVFADGECVTLPSDNAVDPSGFYLRRGGFRQRKLEDWIGSLFSKNVASTLPGAQVRARLARWRRHHPDEERVVERVELVRCRLVFPPPGSDPGTDAGSQEEILGSFDATGKALPQDADP